MATNLVWLQYGVTDIGSLWIGPRPRLGLPLPPRVLDRGTPLLALDTDWEPLRCLLVAWLRACRCLPRPSSSDALVCTCPVLSSVLNILITPAVFSTWGKIFSYI